MVATEWDDVEVVPVAAIELAPVPVVVQPAAAEPAANQILNLVLVE